MSEQRYKTAVIGCGRIAGTHASAYRRRDNRIDLVAGADISAENLEKFQQTYNVPQGYSDYRVMLAEIAPDIVSICTYADLHMSMLEACAEAGVKGIICEKPMLNSPSELPRARELIERTGAKVIVGHMRRYGMAHIRARELFVGGEIGKPVLVMGTLGGGGLAEMGSHWIDLMRFFNDDADIQWVMAQARTRDGQQCGHAEEEHATIYMQFANGAKGVFEAGGGLLTGNVYSLLVGTEGSIQVVGEDDLIISSPAGVRTEALSDEQPQRWKDLGTDLPEPWWDYKWDLLMLDFLAWLDGGDPSPVGFDNAMKTTEAYLAGYQSIIRTDKIDLPMTGDLLTLDEWPTETLARRAAGK